MHLKTPDRAEIREHLFHSGANFLFSGVNTAVLEGRPRLPVKCFDAVRAAVLSERTFSALVTQAGIEKGYRHKYRGFLTFFGAALKSFGRPAMNVWISHYILPLWASAEAAFKVHATKRAAAAPVDQDQARPAKRRKTTQAPPPSQSPLATPLVNKPSGRFSSRLFSAARNFATRTVPAFLRMSMYGPEHPFPIHPTIPMTQISPSKCSVSTAERQLSPSLPASIPYLPAYRSPPIVPNAPLAWP
ncbi:hypothetical protein B0H16DRAFT_1689762 [Mycena metata]|uniref:Uncharacterized protein n=1 Tax=Mycena metata TaxID=1033252 RepID=A0AAD7J755_9AGAR|nr:hypothetical protein B0H16DRAFT_1689762 [Mycena metata]